jgi:hypothetical protein
MIPAGQKSDLLEKELASNGVMVGATILTLSMKGESFMKKIIVMLLALLLLSSCVSQPNGSTPTGSDISASEQTVVSTEPYSFSEVNTLFGPGPFSVNELAEVFGEPTFIGGYYSEKDGENGFFVLNALFKDVIIDLAANNGEKLNFIVKDDSKSPISYDKYQVTNSDREVRMKPQTISIFGGNWELPRKMNFGDSINELYNAYNGNKGKESITQGQFMVFYNYGESGRITYEFGTDAIDDTIYKLEQVTIEWYDAHNWEDVSAPSGVPPA